MFLKIKLKKQVFPKRGVLRRSEGRGLKNSWSRPFQPTYFKNGRRCLIYESMMFVKDFVDMKYSFMKLSSRYGSSQVGDLKFLSVFIQPNTLRNLFVFIQPNTLRNTVPAASRIFNKAPLQKHVF